MSGRFHSWRIEWRLFVAALVAYAFFHQGGGWNQNAKFAMVRAVVEQGTFAIDDFLFYSSADRTEDGFRFVRTPVVEGSFHLRNRDYAVTWPGEDELPVRGYLGDDPPMSLHRIGATADLAYANGHFYPNQAPGTALLAVPAYFVLHGVERLTGLDPDDWWVFTVNAWLTSALSVGLISALGCVLFFRVALMLWGGRLPEATWATLAFAFGTICFPYATMLFEHNVVAVALLAAFYFILRSPHAASEGTSRLLLLSAGASAGYGTISAYSAAVPAALLGLYLLFRGGRRGGWLWFCLGLIGPLALFGFYNWNCFGSPFATHLAFRNPVFQGPGTTFSELGSAQLERLVAVLISPFRGLFFGSPVLLMGLAGLVVLWKGGRRAEVLLFGSVFVYYLLFNISLNRWEGGWGVGPRFLIPALPFLALPVTYGFIRYFRATLVLAVLSVLTMACFTATDPQSPVGTAWIARNPGRPALLREPLTEYALPILLTGKAWPILSAQLEDAVGKLAETLKAEGIAPEESESRLAERRELLERHLERGTGGFSLALFEGPVSARPIGMYERWLGHIFVAGESQPTWNSFNAGELFLSGFWSLLILAAFWLPLVASALDAARTKTGPE